jgi:hypothetical protein
MTTKIKDEFSALPISRQRKYQLRMHSKKRCTTCGAPAAQGTRCLKHQVEMRERMRKKLRLRRRYKNSMSYKLEQGTR